MLKHSRSSKEASDSKKALDSRIVPTSRVGVKYQYAPYLVRSKLTETYVNDPKFRELVDTGRYVLVGNRIVLNSPGCVEYKDGQLEMSEIVEADRVNYCLHYCRTMVFRPRQSSGVPGRLNGRLYKRSLVWGKGEVIEENLMHAREIKSFADVTIDNIIDAVGGSSDGGDDGNAFTRELIRLMKDNNVTVEDLAYLTGLEAKTIQRMRNPKLRTSLRSVIAVCVALHLSPYNSMYLVHLAGFELTDAFEDRVFSFILGFAFKETVEDCNCMLERLNLKPLSNLRPDEG